MIEALFYGERPIAYGSSLINDIFILLVRVVFLMFESDER
jgi:hypothetical protein